MNRKPDTIRAMVLIFAIGLAVSAFTSLQASESDRRVDDAVVTVPGFR